MKYLLLLLLLSLMSCALMKEPVKSATEKVRECVDYMVGIHGIEVQKSFQVCESIYKGK